MCIRDSSGGILLFGFGKWGLFVLLFPGLLPLPIFLAAKRYRKQRSMAVRLSGIAALTLSAPAAYYTAIGRLDGTALGLWAALLVYFGSAQFYVRSWFEARVAHKAGKSKLLPGWLLLATSFWLLVGVILLGGLVIIGCLPWVGGLAYLPLLFKLGMSFRQPPTTISIKQIGLFEFAQSFVFALLLLLSMR